MDHNEKFQDFAKNVLELAKNNNPEDLESLLELDMEGASVKEKVEGLSGVIGEKIEVSRYQRLSGSTVAAYSHMGGKIGALVALDAAEAGELARELAMQVAAGNPRYVDPEDVDEAEIEKEKEIGRETLLKEGKPENIIDKILEGKIKKYCDEICLTKQEYIKDDKKKVEQILSEAKITGFVNFSLQGSPVVCKK